MIARAVCHADDNHASAAYEMTTGNAYPRAANLSNKSTREDHPHFGAAIAAVEARRCPAPPFAMVPQYLVVNGEFRSGQNGGFLGSRYDPLVPGGDPNNPDFKPVDLGLVSSLEPEQMRNRRLLLASVDEHFRRLREDSAVQILDTNYQKAFALLESGVTTKAFDIRREPVTIREKYGRNFFGQSLLLARRLIEAGVRLVHVNCMSSILGGVVNWDTHKDNFKMLKESLAPARRSWRGGPTGRSGGPKSVIGDARRRNGRVWPHAPNQWCRRSRPLAAGILGALGGSRHPGRLFLRRHG